jgi:hypothetical protein
VARRWAAIQPNRLADAILAFERLTGLDELANRPENRDAHRCS